MPGSHTDLLMLSKTGLLPLECCHRTMPVQAGSCQLRATFETAPIVDSGSQRTCRNRADFRDLGQLLAGLIMPVPELLLQLGGPSLSDCRQAAAAGWRSCQVAAK
jgi:hypothetical protein